MSELPLRDPRAARRLSTPRGNIAIVVFFVVVRGSKTVYCGGYRLRELISRELVLRETRV